VLPYIIAGITTGSVYALAAVGLVLTYKTSGIFNFAHGALATCAAFLFYTLTVQHHLPWPAAAGLCVLVAGPILGTALELVARSVAGRSLVLRVVATVGVLLIVQSTVYAIYGFTQVRSIPQFLPGATFDIGSTPVAISDVLIAALGLVATAGLYCYFRIAKTGVAMRAVVSNPKLLDLAGRSPARIRRLAWMIGAAFACASGVLLAPLTTLNSTSITLLVVQAFGAAAIGRFTSLPWTYVGGLVIGVLASLATKYVTGGLLSSLPAALPFVVLFIVLLFSRRRTEPETTSPSVQREAWRAPWPVHTGLGAIVLIALALVPGFVGFHLGDWTLFLSTTIVFLSLGLLVRTSGQVSLAHVGFVAIGASTFSHLTVGQHWPWAAALIGAGLIAVPVGALLSIPAIRLSGLYLALTTLGFSIVLSYMFYSQSFMFGSSGSSLIEPRPSLLGLSDDRNYYYLVLVLTVACSALMIALNRSRLGRLLRALADSPRGLATSGTSVNVTRVLVFCMSTFLAAVGGALGGAAQGIVSADSYPPLLSLTYFAVVVIAAGSEPWFALLAAAGLTLVPSYWPSNNITTYLTLVFGAFALLYAVMPDEWRGVPKPVGGLLDRAFARDRAQRRRAMRVTRSPAARVEPLLLQVADMRIQFGGLMAVDGVSLKVGTGAIVGVIGPNGAGKTTTFNAISGLIKPSSGRVILDGRDVSRHSLSSRARLGLGRTFQQLELFDSMTVRQNVALGREGALAGLNPVSHLLGRGTAATVQTSATQAMDTCAINGLADQVVGTLSTGQRRLVELARCLASPARLLLLDEPSSGLDRAETLRFGQILTDAVRTRGIGILLVEHDMSLVTAICDYIYVLDFGRQIFEGTPAEVMASPLVRAAYLGGDDIESEAEELASSQHIDSGRQPAREQDAVTEARS
jgi:ABC-type branched-subunit amino acid transport system ATPase component/branched-subunit amino acid ABC-type transport system permease component